MQRFMFIFVVSFLTFESPAFAQKNDEAAYARVIELYRAGRYSEAIPLAQQLAAQLEKTLGSDDPNIATALNILAQLYSQQGRYSQAEPLLRRSLAITEKALGAPFASAPMKAATLKVGDSGVWISSCNIIRVTVDTDRGSETYSFGD